MILNAGFDFYTCLGASGLCIASLDISAFDDLPLPILEAASEADYLAAVRSARNGTPSAQFPCEWSCAFSEHHGFVFLSYRLGYWFAPHEHGNLAVTPEYLDAIQHGHHAPIPGKSVHSRFPSYAPKSGQPVVDTVLRRGGVYNSGGLVR